MHPVEMNESEHTWPERHMVLEAPTCSRSRQMRPLISTGQHFDRNTSALCKKPPTPTPGRPTPTRSTVAPQKG